MKKTIRILLAIVLATVFVLTLSLAACNTDPCEKDGHTYDKYTNNGDGTHKISCSVCGDVDKASVAHVYDQTGDKCKCGAVKPGEVSCEHTYDKYTDNGDGTHKVQCSKCNDTQSASVAHVYDQTGDKCKCGADKPVEGDEISFYSGADKVTTYYVDVIDGTWGCDVLAKVNGDTTESVSYTLANDYSYATIDGNTVTATNLGTYKVIATATSDSSLNTEATIVFYSSGMFLAGNHNSWISGNPTNGDILDAEDETYTKFSIVISYAADEEFRIYDGNRGWDNALGAAYLDTPGEGNLWVEAGRYKITVQLTEDGPKISTQSLDSLSAVFTVAGSAETVKAIGSKGNYSMTKMFEANVNDTFTIVLSGFTASSITIDDITKFTGDGAEYITYTDSSFKISTKAKYTLVVTCDDNGDYSVNVTAEILSESNWEANSTYTVAGLYVDYGNVTLGSMTCYFDSANNQYKVCGSVSVTTAGSWFNMGLYQGSAWKKDIQPKTVVADTIGFTNTTDSISATSGYTTFGASKTGTFYFELVFKADLTYVSMAWGTTSFAA